jgi:hypothetical protein
LGLHNRTHIGFEEFKNINWFSTKERFEQCVSFSIYKFCNNLSPTYMSDIYTKADTTYMSDIYTKADTTYMSDIYTKADTTYMSDIYTKADTRYALTIKIV